MAIKDTRWMTGLALRENLLQSNAPHVPILVEDLPKYVSLIDYEENCVKMVHTIGKIGSTFISSITPGTNVDFPFSTDYMSPADMYEATDECTLFQKWTGPVAKVFGFLQQKNDSIVLMATRIIDVEDVKGSWETIMVLSRLVRRQYQQYYRSTEADESLKEEWDSMHRERRRK